MLKNLASEEDISIIEAEISDALDRYARGGFSETPPNPVPASEVIEWDLD